MPVHVIEAADRRVVGAFELVDAATRIPTVPPGTIEARRVILPGAQDEVEVPDRALQIIQNRRGIHVVFRAPLFDTYIQSFDNPQPPAETAAGPLRLRIRVLDAGPQYLPQEFEMRLPRSLDPTDPDSVFVPQRVEMFRAPGAFVQDGWAVLRVRVVESGPVPERPLPGVLVRVFRSPRGLADQPIGVGMTDWRGNARGEAIVPVTGLQRFRPGSGQDVVETDLAIVFEATRDTRFTGAGDQTPDVARLIAGTADGIVRPPDRPVNSVLQVQRPPAPLRVQVGREYVVQLAMP